MNKGIDVCTYQGVIDWAKIKNDDVTFAMIKATQGRSETNYAQCDITDVQFRRNIVAAPGCGISVGVYHYLTATTVAEAHKEAKQFIDAISVFKDKITLYAAVDVESKYLPVNKTLLTNIVKAFYDDVEKAGYKSAVYTNPDFLKNRLNIGEMRLWLALWRDKNKTPTSFRNMVMWQWGAGNVKGVTKTVDCNFGFFDAADNKATAPAKTAIKAGDKVRVKNAVLYGTNKRFMAIFPSYTVLQVNGDRIVIGIGKIVVAAVHADNLTRV